MISQYPISAAAKLTGIPLDTLRAWERRYSAVVPVRTARGRAYTQQQIERLLLLREAVAQGHSIGQVAAIPDRKLSDLLKKGTSLTTNPALYSRGAGEREPVGDILLPVMRALDRFDYAATERELNRLAAVVASPRDLVHQVALPLMRTVGERWHAGKCSIAQEHLLSSLLAGLLASLVRTYSNSKSETNVLFTTPRTERHAFPLLAAAMLTAAGGLGVIYLGTELPAGDVILAGRRSEADVILLSLSAEPTRESLEDLRMVGKKISRRTELWLGASPDLPIDPKQVGDRWRLLNDFMALEYQLKAHGAKF
jgi:DNA-binding transcriptional MerR regulator